jgi:hypothetical protein
MQYSHGGRTDLSTSYMFTSRNRVSFEREGCAIYLLCHFQVRTLTLVAASKANDLHESATHCICTVRQSGRFLGQGNTPYVLVEERNAVAICLQIDGNGANHYSIVLLGDSAFETPTISDDMPSFVTSRSFTRVDQFKVELSTMLLACYRSWSKILDQLDKEISVLVS